MKTIRKTTDLEPFDWQSLLPAPIVGVDEVGRGCLAGPVYAAAAIVPADQTEILQKLGVTDSKLLSSARREVLALEIQNRCLVALGYATPEEIDQINILQASFLAMRRAIQALEAKVRLQAQSPSAPFGFECAHLIVDGNQRIPMPGADCAVLGKVRQTTIVKGDLRALPIAAASIVAKVARDQLMIEAAVEFPQYGFEKHKGYAAPIHRQAIAEHGPTRIHRKTFGGVREFIHSVVPCIVPS